ncbi:hypothetical protein MBGDF03_01184, partial [Thermoplasmatales archaeon SCGC AB-540-F20]
MSERTLLTRILDINAYVPGIIGFTSVLVGFILFYLIENEAAGTLYVTVGIGFFTWALASISNVITNEIKDLVTKTNTIINDIKTLVTKVKNLVTKTNKSISITNKQ